MVRTLVRSARVLVGAGVVVAALAVWAGVAAAQQGAALTVSPAAAQPGETVRVAVSGIPGLPAGGATLCIGFLGPGQNLELGLSPSFRSRLGTVMVGADGAGAAEVRVPIQAAVGVYRVTVGGCPPQADLAPLAWVAEGRVTVTRGGVVGLPATGGGSGRGLLGLASLMLLAGAALGVRSAAPNAPPTTGYCGSKAKVRSVSRSWTGRQIQLGAPGQY